MYNFGIAFHKIICDLLNFRYYIKQSNFGIGFARDFFKKLDKEYVIENEHSKKILQDIPASINEKAFGLPSYYVEHPALARTLTGIKIFLDDTSTVAIVACKTGFHTFLVIWGS